MNGQRRETLDEEVARLQKEIDEEESEVARELIRKDMREECFKLEGKTNVAFLIYILHMFTFLEYSVYHTVGTRELKAKLPDFTKGSAHESIYHTHVHMFSH